MRNYALMLVGLMLVLTVGGCASSWSKGEGTLFESHSYIGKAPMAVRSGLNNPFATKTEGPAEIIVKHPPVNPVICDTCNTAHGKEEKKHKRTARDY